MLVNMENIEDPGINNEMKRILKEAHKQAVQEIEKICAICGKNITSFCKSHTVPHSFLNNIAMKQNMLSIHSVIDANWTKQDKGANEAGIFYSICEQCDHELFSTYENKTNYNNDNLINKMLEEIVLKIAVKEIYEHRIAAKQAEILLKKFDSEYLEETIQAETETLNTTIKELNRFLRKWRNLRVIYFKKLPYKIPIAYQDQIAVFSDFEGNIINNTYINSDRIQVLYECLLPLEEKSIILLFTLETNNRYSKFIRKFNNLVDEEKQKVLLYLMFSYSQNFFISKSIEKIILSDNYIKELSKKTMISINPAVYMTQIESYINTTIETAKSFSLENYTRITNYLSKKYSM